MDLETFRALDTLARRHRCPTAFRLALRALLNPEDLATLQVGAATASMDASAKAKGIPDAAVLAALRELGPGTHRVWQVQERLGLPIGGREGLATKGTINSRLVRLRRAGLVSRDERGRGWSAI